MNIFRPMLLVQKAVWRSALVFFFFRHFLKQNKSKPKYARIWRRKVINQLEGRVENLKTSSAAELRIGGNKLQIDYSE